MNYKKALVTGSSGFLASHIVDTLVRNGIEVQLFDSQPSPYKNNDQNELVGNLLNETDLRKAMQGCDLVYHFAAQADIEASSLNPAETIESNIMGTLNVLEIAKDIGVKRLLFASTIYVYSGHLGSFYRVSKQSCEKIIEEYYREFGLKYTILRYGSLYGPRANEFNAIRRFIFQALKDKKIVRQGNGEELREYIHVKDAAQLSFDALNEKFINKHLIISGNQQIKIKELLIMIKEILNNKIEIKYVKSNKLYHYEITPYNYRPQVAKKVTSNSYYDLGQGIMDQIYEFDTSLVKKT